MKKENLFKPIDIVSLVWFRHLFGAIMLLQVWAYFAAGLIEKYFIQPSFYFKYFGFEWLAPWPGTGMYFHFFILGLLALGIMLGCLYHFCATLFFLGFTYVFLLDQTWYLNHYYMIILLSFLMIFVPANRNASMDAHFLFPRIKTDTIPAWSLGLLRIQIGLVYFFAGLAKINADWLTGEPMRIWLAQRTGFPVIGPFLAHDWAPYFFSYGGLLIDLLFLPLVFWRPTRIPMLIVATLFHLFNMQLFQIGTFPILMIACNLLFLSPSWPRVLSRRKQLPLGETVFPKKAGWITALIAIYVSVQILIPLRHILYPGNTAWTEEGHRFSWRMMLRDKKARVRFFVTKTPQGKESEVNPLKDLSPEQFEEMSIRPDMIQQYAKYLKARLAGFGVNQAQVRVEAYASLNGRPEQLLIDPKRDLSKTKRSLGHADWILPLK